ncbi:serine/threonine protein kinase [Fischerella thermalis CCMEE 5198]|uniref:serine/threonine-protein kinase n=1 Tax=Fischerella thermalis TaxID=372787 RepID=UPI000C7FF603|nr:serine/threonine-protein kinase [Fischerella thermalis]PLZ88095.1 serine/threonine protein kinase [Fischerella thermalis CCMEE 5196]PMB18369.1 serine/threonine protein kinase [Fischerella thermalis CCMEE 5198]
MAHHMIGKVLQGQYQIVQSLGAGVFGQTYIAINVEQPNHPKCVIKQLKVSSSQPAYLQSLRLHFLTETETLRYLGHHDQIPQLIACFEENERFYLVQEFIEGHALTTELPINQRAGYLWTESEIIQFLQDVLGILNFVHSQGVIHCDVKPENLIRRTCDGKLVLIDFGSIQPINFGIDTVLPIYRVPVTSLGYIPPEQFIDQTQPNSDIYAVGMIAIQALTGLSPLQLKIDPHSNEFIWRSHQTPVSDYLAAILSQMIRYNYKDRFQSASEILRALEQMSLEYSQAQTNQLQSTVLRDSTDEEDHFARRDASVKSPPLLTGMRVGLVANSLVVGFGVYSLMNSPAYSETETLYKATEEFQSGDLEKAIALAKSIPENSNVYPEAQTTIEEWQNQWQLATEQYLLAKKALDEGQWSEAIHAASQVPDILYWQSKTDQIVEQAKAKIETQTNSLLARAYEKAAVKDFSTALTYLQQVPKETSATDLVKQKLTEYHQKQQIRAIFLLQQAYNKAQIGEFETAVKFLQQVPENSSVYATAKAKLEEYTQKQRLQTKNQKVAPSKVIAAISKETSMRESFDPSTLLQEVNITPNATPL